MRVAVSSTGNKLDSQIDPRFGRCTYFLIIETDDMSFEVVNNENIALGGGAGIQSAQFVASKGVSAVLTGNCGPNAVRTLGAAGLDLFVGQTGTVKQAVERFKNGELTATNTPNVSDHHGMGGGATGGRGGGRGRIAGTSPGNAPSPAVSGTSSRGKELNLLKEEALELKKQMEDIQARIDNLSRT